MTPCAARRYRRYGRVQGQRPARATAQIIGGERVAQAPAGSTQESPNNERSDPGGLPAAFAVFCDGPADESHRGGHAYVVDPKESSPEIPIPISMCPTRGLMVIFPGCENGCWVAPLRDRAQRDHGAQADDQQRRGEGYASVQLEFEPGFDSGSGAGTRSRRRGPRLTGPARRRHQTPL